MFQYAAGLTIARETGAELLVHEKSDIGFSGFLDITVKPVDQESSPLVHDRLNDIGDYTIVSFRRGDYLRSGTELPLSSLTSNQRASSQRGPPIIVSDDDLVSKFSEFWFTEGDFEVFPQIHFGDRGWIRGLALLSRATQVVMANSTFYWWGSNARALVQPLGELRGNHFREFRRFLVGNPKPIIRNAFFTELSRHRFVTSPGAVFHNAESIDSSDSADMGQAKLSTMRNFSFSIAMENSQHPGYSTEKITDAFFGGAIPIYWGNPLVNVDFDRRTFLNLASFPSIMELVERVVELDEYDQLLEPMLSVPPLHRHTYEEIARPERLEEFLFGAISRARQRPDRSMWKHRATMGRVGRVLKFVGVDRVVSWSSQPR